MLYKQNDNISHGHQKDKRSIIQVQLVDTVVIGIFNISSNTHGMQYCANMKT
jgi:hypothetical protein